MRTWRALAICLCLAGAACGGGAGREAPGSEPFGEFPAFAPADVVFGQPVFVFHDPNQGAPGPGPGTLACPGMPALGPLFMPDVDNHRVLGFAQTPILNNLEANFVLGQPDFQFGLPGLGATAMNAPTAAVIHAGRLAVSDTGNHRVLLYADVPSASRAAATVAIGQADLQSSVPAAGRSGLRQPTGLASGGGRLVVVDRGNHRVLVFLSSPTGHAAQADLVLGQAHFDGTSPNRGAEADAATLFAPTAAWTDGTRLVVADHGNHRVLMWHTFPTQNGAPADLVLGQVDFGTRVPSAGRVGLFLPSDVHSDGSRLLVADAGNHRILVWYLFPETSGALPDAVLGQADFDHRAPNDDDQDGLEDANPSARTFKSKAGILTVRFDGQTLFVGDAGNHRLLVFKPR
ncbi:MAG: hypothetical protein O2894_04955 [Planctomycetota bacterium]|nr:hypothetical protein [Planctomycetota bacterium]